MTGGRNLLMLGGVLAVVSCTANHQVQVRAIPNPGATSKSGDALLAQARGEIALGNVGLALENLRTLQREQPENPEVFEAIAQCYGAMSRFDLVRTNLEFALAYAPNDPRLLNELASSLDQLGEREQAAEVRAEAARLIASPAAQPLTQQAAVTPMGVPRTGSITVKLPPPAPIARKAAAKPLTRQASVSPSQPPGDVPFPRVATVKSDVSVAAAPGSLTHQQSLSEMRLPKLEGVAEAAAPAPAQTSMPPAEVSSLPSLTAPRSRIDLAVAPPSLSGQQVLAEMKVERLVAQPELSATVATPAPIGPKEPTRRDPLSSRIQPVEIARADPPPKEGPYLERTSRSEVTLITTVPHIRMAQLDKEIVRAPTIAPIAPTKRPAPPEPKPQQMALVATRVQWVPLKYASMPQNVELLNAARSQGLAARTRIALQDRGWRKIRIGNARNVRQRSLVLYSAARVQIAHRLAAQFRCAALKVAGLKNVVVLLGRDAAARRGQPARA